jgi:hypothetical protein
MPRSAWFVVGFCAVFGACSDADGAASAGSFDQYARRFGGAEGER